MANITFTGIGFRVGRSHRVRVAAAQATVGQTDWIKVPTWATYCRVTIDLTAMAGTSPTHTPTLLTPSDAAKPHLSDNVSVVAGTDVPPTDSVVIPLGGTALTSGYTAAGTSVISIGPGVTGIANDVALGTTGVNAAAINDVLPDIIGIKVLNTRTNGNETYTYTVDVLFR
jgi:hypothetical protein